MNSKTEVMNTMYCAVDAWKIVPSTTTTNNDTTTCWEFWQNDYYPRVIRGDRAKDKGRQAFEIIKVLKDKKLVKIEKVSNFIDLMDELIKIL